MANGNVDNKIVVGIDQAASKKLIEKDLKKLLSQIKDLEVQVGRIKLDKKAISELEAGFQSLGQASQKLSEGQKGLFDVSWISTVSAKYKEFSSFIKQIAEVAKIMNGGKDSPLAPIFESLDRRKVLKIARILSRSNMDKEMIKRFIVQIHAFGSFKINQRGVIAGSSL